MTTPDHSDSTGSTAANHRQDAPLVDFMQRFVNSRQFQQVFEEGMQLVEETADYLDGPGREQARTMSRDAAMTYATESMRLTTRLMQLASWLLLQRAVAAGELSEQDARKEQEGMDLSALPHATDAETLAAMPEELAALIQRGERLHARILKLDAMISRGATPPAEASGNPLSPMLERLSSAFNRAPEDEN